MDDIGIGTLLKDIVKHIEMIHNLFTILAAHGLLLKLSKSVFMQPQMDFLGIRINKDGISIDPTKISEIADWPEELHMVKQVCAILGICSYYHMHIPHFSFIVAPLTQLTGKDIPFK
jgi:hypothetical protein